MVSRLMTREEAVNRLATSQDNPAQQAIKYQSVSSRSSFVTPSTTRRKLANHSRKQKLKEASIVERVGENTVLVDINKLEAEILGSEAEVKN